LKVSSCTCRTLFDWAGKDARIKELAALSEAPGFWDDPKKAGSVLKELEGLKSERESFQALKENLSGLRELFSGELSPADEKALGSEFRALAAQVDDWEQKALLGGPYDRLSALLTIRSGAGGVDAQDWAAMLMRMYLRYAEQAGFAASVVEESPGAEAGIKSATLELDGPYAYGLLHGEAGIHRLVRLSPFNAQSLRQTSFASVEVMPVVETDAEVDLKPDELRIDTYRASGAGGQHVNKTESAVRNTHLPTGITASAQSERSQLQNREEAMKLLRGRLLQKKLEEQAEERARLRGEHKSAEWGNQIRSYVLHPYTLVKDHRTGTESSDTAKILDGGVQLFIESELRFFAKNKS
jgi:peptide chain release factor 2